jgi:F-type H+-transporting ATPase subunit delta
MTVSKPARRYAKALGQLAAESGVSAQVGADLESVRGLLQRVPAFRFVARSPVVDAERRGRLLRLALEGRVHPLFMRFIRFLVARSRTGLLDEIGAAYARLRDEDSGVIRATVTSARPLAGDQVEALRAALGRRFGGRIVTEQSVNPDLLGGVVIRVGDTVLNGTVAHQLETFRRRMLTT